MGKTSDLFKKIRDAKGTVHAKMGSIKDRNGMDLTEVEDIKKRWQEYTELYQNDLHDPDKHNGVITHLEPGDSRDHPLFKCPPSARPSPSRINVPVSIVFIRLVLWLFSWWFLPHPPLCWSPRDRQAQARCLSACPGGAGLVQTPRGSDWNLVLPLEGLVALLKGWVTKMPGPNQPHWERGLWSIHVICQGGWGRYCSLHNVGLPFQMNRTLPITDEEVPQGSSPHS